MKKGVSVLGIAALVAIIGFGVSSCDLFGDNDSAYYAWYGSGTATHFTISSAAQLRGLSNIVRGIRGEDTPPQDDFRGKTIILTADLNLTNQEWRSIGWSYLPLHPFNGTFDGDNRTITGFNTTSNQGFFGLIGEHGTVKNINFVDFSVSGSDGEGGLARTNHGMIQNISIINGAVNGSAFTGGVVSFNSGTIQNTSFSGTISGVGSGGIASSNSGTIQSSVVTGTISSSSSEAGGISGNNSGMVRNSYSTADITGTGSIGHDIGGIVGINSGTVQHSFSTGNVTGAWRVGGVVGTGGLLSGTVLNSVALNPSVTGTSATSTARVANMSHVNNNYARVGMTLPDNVAVVSDINGAHGADITSAEWNNANWWQNTAGFPSDAWEFRAGLPILRNMPAAVVQNPVVRN
ncbi:MAG: hypothetical protein FWC64_04005 [Treponema sp.]|nr:hypothetical protein [Treponema sp.]